MFRVESAWQLAQSAHAGQTRQSGESYDSHPLAVAELVFGLFGADPDAICAALLHDVVEDSDTSLTSISNSFGSRVARLVDGVSKLEQVPTVDGSLTSVKDGTLRKLIAAGGRDKLVFAVKLCDRLHNMRTLGSVGYAKQRRVALETRLVYAPLARYVGFHQIAADLEALSVRWLFPWRWVTLWKWVKYKFFVDRLRLYRLFVGIEWAEPDDMQLLDDRVANSMVVRCFALLRGDRACRGLFSVPIVFVLCDSIEQAYERIGVLHRNFAYLPASFASFSSEGSVSSKFLTGPQSLVVEFNFFFPRVYDAHVQQAALNAVTSSGDGEDDDDFSAVATVTEQSGEFTRILREFVEFTSIAVFTPHGRRFSLPSHASGLDFAFAIHTDLGLRADGVRINGRLCSASTELSSGDVVEVVVSDNILAKPEWEAVLRSPRARTKLRHWLRQIKSEDAISLGRRLLIDAGGTGDIAALASLLESEPLRRELGISNIDDLLRRIGMGELSAFSVASRLRDSGADQLLRSTAASDQRSRLLLNGEVIAGVEYCDLCMPIPGDPIVAVGSFSGAKIHRVSCNQSRGSRLANAFFSPMWSAKIVAALPAKIRVLSDDRRALLADCALAISNCHVDVTAVVSQSNRDITGPFALLDFTVQVRSVQRLDRCLTTLRTIFGVRSANRLDSASGKADPSTFSTAAPDRR
jgi:GTP pyrophosphokinase